MKKAFLPFLLVAGLAPVASVADGAVPIEDHLAGYYRQAFPAAALKTAHAVPDPITEGAINNTYLKIYDSAGAFLGYVREVSTTTGCNQYCKPLDFTLALSPDGSFRALLVQEPLTKLGHRKFTDADYAKLDSILENNPESFKVPSQPMDLVDATTRVTRPEYKNDVVPTAALTSFRIYEYEKQTIQHIKSVEKKKAGAVDPGASAPAFMLPDFHEKNVLFDPASGASPYKNKVTVMLFFATWCPDCRKELPQFQKLFEKYRGNPAVEFVGIRTWRNREHEDYKEFVGRFGLGFALLSDTPKENPPYSKVAKLYGLEWVPTLFIIDKKGVVRHRPENVDSATYVEKMSALIDPLAGEPRFERFELRAIGTRISVTYPGARDVSVEREVRDFFDEFESGASLYRSDSRLRALNMGAPGVRIKTGRLLCELLLEGVKYTRASEGRFDITYKNPSIDALGLDCGRDEAWVGRSGVFIDPGGIGAGFAADRIGAMLRRRGMRDFVVDTGGELLVCGRRGTRPWRIGMENQGILKPRAFAGGCCGVSTSGGRARYVNRGGESFSLIVDPVRGGSGAIRRDRVRTVTVVAATAAAADALSTALAAGADDVTYVQRMKRLHGVEVLIY
ncbi:MAG: hypothetical protein A2583_11765 [Bdellovibrionales bacterium RIFOXYD1_FULL_53_11]|nr:MAG: hypothetical protein A2583_11765 [Bdellovibrionales bacterium RIFOXYD1_FULL_53_11]